jgi:hypothetical protein
MKRAPSGKFGFAVDCNGERHSGWQVDALVTQFKKD